MVDAKSEVGKILTMIHHFNLKSTIIDSEIDTFEDPNPIV